MEEKVVYDKVTKFKISSDKTNLNYSIMSIRWNFLEINPTNSCDTCENSNIQALFLNNWISNSELINSSRK